MRTAILGVGLIGGSIGLALRAAGWPVIGWGPRQETLQIALRRGAVELVAGSVAEAVAGAELVIVASPIRAIPDLFRAIAASAALGATVTDVASVKGQVMGWAAELLPAHLRFVGGHPMAGKETQGIEAAAAELLRGCTYCLVPGSNDGLPAAKALVEVTGGRLVMLSAEDHDRAVAAASHLPFVAAAALVRAIAPDLNGLAGTVASSGFRDTTRVALASPAMHADICNFNAPALCEVIDRLQAELAELRAALPGSNLESWFQEATRARQEWQDRQNKVKTYDGRD